MGVFGPWNNHSGSVAESPLNLKLGMMGTTVDLLLNVRFPYIYRSLLAQKNSFCPASVLIYIAKLNEIKGLAEFGAAIFSWHLICF